MTKQNDLPQNAAEFLVSPVNSSVAILEFISTIIFNILRAACVPAELIFRRRFGERHFNLWLYIAGLPNEGKEREHLKGLFEVPVNGESGQ